MSVGVYVLTETKEVVRVAEHEPHRGFPGLQKLFWDNCGGVLVASAFMGEEVGRNEAGLPLFFRTVVMPEKDLDDITIPPLAQIDSADWGEVLHLHDEGCSLAWAYSRSRGATA